MRSRQTFRSVLSMDIAYGGSMPNLKISSRNTVHRSVHGAPADGDIQATGCQDIESLGAIIHGLPFPYPRRQPHTETGAAYLIFLSPRVRRVYVCVWCQKWTVNVYRGRGFTVVDGGATPDMQPGFVGDVVLANALDGSAVGCFLLRAYPAGPFKRCPLPAGVSSGSNSLAKHG